MSEMPNSYSPVAMLKMTKLCLESSKLQGMGAGGENGMSCEIKVWVVG